MAKTKNKSAFCDLGQGASADHAARIRTAIDVAGADICRAAYYAPGSIVPVVKSLKDYYSAYDRTKAKTDTLKRAFGAISPAWKNAPVYPLVLAYAADKETQSNLLQDFAGKKYVYKIPMCFESIAADALTFDRVLRFLKFLESDIGDVAHDILGHICKEERLKTILECRTDKWTLEATSQIVGITRERIRQVENRISRIFNVLSRQGSRILWLVSAALGGATIIGEDDFFGAINSATDEKTAKTIYHLLCIAVEGSECHSYNENLRIFIIGEGDNENMKKMVEQLPDGVMDVPRMEAIIKELSQKGNCSHELTKKTIESRYVRSGNFYFDKRLRLSDMCDYIMERYYPCGINPHNGSEIEKFKKHINNIFGEGKFSGGDRALEARIAGMGVLCDSGTYIHKKYVNIPDKLIAKIDRFIKSSPKPSITYSELFERFEEELINTSIDNKHYLHGILRAHLKNKYKFERSYISKSYKS